MTPFKQADIQVTDIESKQASTGNWKYKITDSEKNKYYFWRTVKGADSEVFTSFNSMGVKNGDIIHISYTEEEKSFTNNKGETVKYTERFIGSMREAGGNPQLKPLATAQSAKYESTDNFGLRLAIHGMVNGLLASGMSASQIEEELPSLFKLEAAIDERLNKPMSMNVAEAKIEQNIAPDIAEAARDMENMIEDIPF